MVRNRLALGIVAALAAAGCKSANTTVFVDLNAVQAQLPESVTASIETPQPPAARPERISTIPRIPAIDVSDPANAPRQTVQGMFEAEQAKAFAELQRRLRQFYDSEIKTFRLQQERSITGEEQLAYVATNAKIRPIFERWANERAPIFARLALVAGFPDPNPESIPSDRQLSANAKRRAEEAKQLRIDLKRIDAEFQAASKTLLASLLAKSASDQAALKLRIEEFANMLDKRAQEEARSQIRQAASHLTFKLADPTPLHLPEIAQKQVTIPAETPLERAPEVPSMRSSVVKAQRRQMLEQELKIWLALNRYTLVQTPKGHRNATNEFLTWRQHHVLGR